MDRHPSPSGALMVELLERMGFTVARVSGHHHILRHADGRCTTVPVHPDRELAERTVQGIMRDAGIVRRRPPLRLLNILGWPHRRWTALRSAWARRRR